jgi:flagellar assembly factor FliW
MLHQSVRSPITTPSGIGMMETIKSRFGDITVDPDKALFFPRGLLGMPDKFRFALTSFPNEKMQQFTLLQSLDDTSLSFIALPLDINNSIIGLSDLQTACRDLQIPAENLALLLIASVHRGPEQVRLSVNARAPILVDAQQRTGAQYVFQQDHYKVQHML